MRNLPGSTMYSFQIPFVSRPVLVVVTVCCLNRNVVKNFPTYRVCMAATTARASVIGGGPLRAGVEMVAAGAQAAVPSSRSRNAIRIDMGLRCGVAKGRAISGVISLSQGSFSPWPAR